MEKTKHVHQCQQNLNMNERVIFFLFQINIQVDLMPALLQLLEIKIIF